MPWMGLIAKFGTSMTFSIAWISSYSNRCTFPLLKRSTAIGICNFCARFATIFAPLVAELEKPIPVCVAIGVAFLGIIVTMFMPSYSEERWRMRKFNLC